MSGLWGATCRAASAFVLLAAMLSCITPGYADLQADIFSDAMRPAPVEPSPADDTSADAATEPEEPGTKPDDAGATSDDVGIGPGDGDQEGRGTAPQPTTSEAMAGEEPQPGAPEAETELRDDADEALTTLPEPGPDTDVISVQADELYRSAEGLQATGNIHIGYQDYRATGQVLDLDRERVWLTLRGDVRISSSDMLTTADRLELNLASEQWHAFDSRTRVEPAFFSMGVEEPLYLDGRQIHGRPGQVEVHEGYGTSCDREEHPHYGLRSDNIRVVPEQYVVFEKPTLYLRRHRLLRFPWDLRLSLRQHTNRFIPEFGQNEVEGYFAKAAYMYLLNEANSGVLRLHMTQKRGPGLGFDHDFEFGRNYGTLVLFGEPSEGSWSGRLSDTHQFSERFTADLTSNAQRYSGYEWGTKSIANNLNFRRRTDTAQSLLGVQHSLMESGTSTNRRMTVNLSHRKQPSRDYSWEVRSVFSRSSFGAGSPSDEQLDAELRMRGRQRAYDWEAITQKRFDLRDDEQIAARPLYSVDYLPQLVVNTDSSRLGDWRLLGRSRIRASLNLGRFHQEPQGLDVSRAAMDITLPGTPEKLGSRHELTTSARFQQQFTSEGSALYYKSLRSELRGKWSGSWDYRLDYNFSSAHGYSPLRIGYLGGRSTYLSFQTVRVVPDRMRLDLSTGYDFVNNYYRDATFRGEFMLSQDSRLELQTSYNLDGGHWRPLNLRWLHANDDWYSATTLYYDTDRSKLTQATTELNWRISDKWHLDMLAAYSGYTHKLDQLEVQLLRDLHCMLASVSYNKALDEFRVNFGIKAFPSSERAFGMGAGGARFESTFGEMY